MNHCTFEGRLSGKPEARELPSGDEIVVFRVIVPRHDGGRVDTIDCSAATPSLRKRVLALAPDATIAIEGALHRRFFRGANGVASRYEVQVHALKRMRVRATAEA